MAQEGLSVPVIAKIEKCDESYVRRLLDPPREAETEAGADSHIKPLRRRTLLPRAGDYVERHPVYALGLAENSFWVRVVIAVHEHGDGFQLRIGEKGAQFQTRHDLRVLMLGQLAATEKDIDGWLEELFVRGRLIDVGGKDIGLPLHLGLTPGETARGKPARRASTPPGHRQTEMLTVVQGGCPIIWRDRNSRLPRQKYPPRQDNNQDNNSPAARQKSPPRQDNNPISVRRRPRVRPLSRFLPLFLLTLNRIRK